MPAFNNPPKKWFSISQVSAIALVGFALTLVFFPQISHAIRNSLPVNQASENLKRKTNRLLPDSVPGEILVRFRSLEAAARATKDGGTSLSVKASGRQIPMQLEGLGGDRELVEGLRLVRVAATDTDAAIQALKSRPDVLYAEPNFIRRKEAVPNDPRYPEMWNLKNPGGSFAVAGADIKAEQAWDTTTGHRNVVVAVIDEGIDINHQDLQANIWRNPGETAGNGIDDDANGAIDDVNGFDFFHNDGSVFDGPGTNPDGSVVDAHGTHVAGTVGATGNNAVGVVGVNWQTSLMALKALGPDGGSSGDLIKAYIYARMMRDRWVNSGGTQGANIRITNNSYGGDEFSQSEVDAIQGLGASGILFVASAGNSGEDNNLLPTFPANYDLPNIISVAATDRSDKLWSSSNFGSLKVHVGAPGVQILSTVPGNAYAFLTGTSMASPHVAGVAALVLDQHPNFSFDRLRASILFGGAPITALTNKTETGNRLDAVGALQNAQEVDLTSPSPITDLHIASIDGRTVTLAWTASGDDGASGQAVLVETRFIDQGTGKQFLIGASSSAPAGAPQFASVNIPYAHANGTISLKVIDNAGNSTSASVPVAVDPASVIPYEITQGPAEPLSTGGTPLHQNFDDAISHFELPFTFPFFGHDVQSVFGSGPTSSVNFSTNGVLYIPRDVPPTNDAFRDPNRLTGWPMIAGLWDDLDLSTSQRADADIFVVKPDNNRVIFRWQGVPCNVNLNTGQCAGGGPVNFEIEIKIDGTIITRYGDGNTNLRPVVGISGGDHDSFVVTSHTSNGAPINLTNAPTITYRPLISSRSADMRGIPSVKPGSVLLGQNAEITIEANNAGPQASAGVKVQGLLPPDLTFISCTTPQGACWGTPSPSGTRVTAEVGTVNAGSPVPIKVAFNATRSTALGRFFPYSTTWTTVSSTYDPILPNTSNFTFNGINPNTNPLSGAIAIGAGNEHSLAILPGGNVIGWGSNAFTQLGDDTFPSRVGPVYITGITDVVAVDGSFVHSLALKSDGTVWAWGGNFDGELGDNTTTNRILPAPVSGLANITAISANLGHNVALRNDGTVWTWGLNNFGQLGDGTTTNRLTPVQVAGLTGIIAVSAGAQHTAALKNDGTVWTWGRNDFGRLGDGTQTNRSLPVQAVGVTNIIGIAAGGGQGAGHTLALRNDGTVLAWGFNGFGQLGNGSFLSSNTVVQTTGLNNVIAIAAGRDHSVALKNDGTVWSWGLNLFGQLGQVDSAGDQNRPIQTLWLSGITAIAAGDEFSLALGTGGKIFGWGRGHAGQLGDGTSDGGRPYAYDVIAAKNLIDEPAFFVRRHYLDFFSREPDPGGFQHWTLQIVNCMSDAACIELKRINGSAAFFLSIEFQETGYLVERLYKTAYGDTVGTSTLGGVHQLSVPIVRFNELLPDAQTIGQGFVVGNPGWEQILENNKQSFTAAFVQRSRFTTAFPGSMGAAQFVDTLNSNAGNPLSTAERNQLVNDLSTNAKTRAQVLRAVAEDSDLKTAESNRAFVLMQYFGYLRRNPNEGLDVDHTGYDFWLRKLNQFDGNFINAEMVKAFIVSEEYRHRFGL